MEIILYKNIVSNPDVCNGKPIFSGTRITVKTIMEFLLAGDNDKEILKSYPKLKQEDLQTGKEFTTMLFEKPLTIQPLNASIK
ncbi:MAG: DUF433 domain-containing protein [Bacteroidetes bacterium]|nr:DUF433 domain-containing protein [Bacteroidota bacterium]MBS1591862.1 DUF433 domain-containing protein [Bacteroidota bacterium]